MIVLVLLIQNLLQQEPHLLLEIPHYLVVITRAYQVLELFQYFTTFPRIKLLTTFFESLQRLMQFDKFIPTWDSIKVYVEQRFHCSLALN